MKEIFYIITMKTKANKTIYLFANEKNNGKVEWCFRKKDAIWFETFRDAERFAKNYFKNFNNWVIEEIIYMI